MARPARLPFEEQREEIVRAAAAALQRQGHERLRLVHLAETLGMSHSNLYRFFGSRDALFDAVVDSWLTESRALVEALADSDEEPLRKLENIVVAVHLSAREKLSEDPFGFELYEHLFEQRAQAAQGHIEFIAGIAKGLIEAGQAAGDLPRVDSWKLVTLLKAGLVKYQTPALIRESLAEDTEPQLRCLLRSLLLAVKTQPALLETF